MDDFAAEVPPDNGTLLVFKRSDNSWHGHHPFEGPRRSLQMNWMTSEGSKGWHKVRHTLSAAVKKLVAGLSAFPVWLHGRHSPVGQDSLLQAAMRRSWLPLRLDNIV